MKKLLILFTFFIFFSNFSFAQYKTESEKKREIERFHQKQKNKQDLFINEFIDGLEADEFQKEIIKQKLYNYVDAKKEILKMDVITFKKQELLDELDANHFNDLKEIISEDIIQKIQSLIKNENTKKSKEKK